MRKKVVLCLGRGLTAFTLFAAACFALGRGFWFFESAAYWIPCLTALSALGLAGCWLAGNRRWAIAAAVCVAFHGGWLAWGTAPWPFYSPPSHAPNLRVLTANVYDKQHHPEALLALIREEHPDVVLLQEVDDAWRKLLAPLESEYPNHHVCARYPGGSSDLAMYWRPASAAAEELADTGLPGVAVDIKVNGVALRVVNVHTAAPFSPNRAKRYRGQMEALVDMANNAKTPLILGGDFNGSVWSPFYRKFMRQSGLRSARYGLGLLGTWPSFFGPFRTSLDHLIASPVIDTVSCRVGPGIGSDHRPLIADFYIAPANFGVKAARPEQ